MKVHLAHSSDSYKVQDQEATSSRSFCWWGFPVVLRQYGMSHDETSILSQVSLIKLQTHQIRAPPLCYHSLDTSQWVWTMAWLLCGDIWPIVPVWAEHPNFHFSSNSSLLDSSPLLSRTIQVWNLPVQHHLELLECCCLSFILFNIHGVSELAQWVEAFVTKPMDESSKLTSDLHTCAMVHRHMLNK